MATSTPAPTQDEADEFKLQAHGEAEDDLPPTEPPLNVDIPAVLPTTATIGDTLSCTTGNWTGTPDSYAYQWKRNNATNIGTDAATYVVTEGDVNDEVVCVVTATNAIGSAAAPPSNAATIIPRAV